MDLAEMPVSQTDPRERPGGETVTDWLAYTVAICAGLLTMMLVGQLPVGR